MPTGLDWPPRDVPDFAPDAEVVVHSPMLRTIDGKRGRVVRATMLNANHVPGWVVDVDGREWELYLNEVEPALIIIAS